MLLLTKYTVLYKENEICCIILLSLPSRERGLKSINCVGCLLAVPSLPSRERGLKFLSCGSIPHRDSGRSLRGSVD